MVSISKIALSVGAAFTTGVTMLPPAMAQDAVATTVPADARAAAPLSAGELEQLVAPIALYPDALLSQVLMASTYPLEVVEAARWRDAHPGLAGDDLENALHAEDWDPSVKSLVAFPTVLKMLNDRISWTSRLGDTFLAQQDAVMDTVQQLRSRAHAAGNLESSSQQIVTVAPETGGATVIRIEPAQPDVVYVPTYNPTVVYGPWLYPAYPPYYWYPAGYYTAGVAISFGVGLFVGHALWGGYDWHRHRVSVVNVYNYNNFNRSHYRSVSWRHDPYHRRGVDYHDRGVRSRMAEDGHRDRTAMRDAYRSRTDGFRRDADGGGRNGPNFGGRSDADRHDGGRGGPDLRAGDRPGAERDAGRGGRSDGAPGSRFTENRPNANRPDRTPGSNASTRPDRAPGMSSVGAAASRPDRSRPDAGPRGGSSSPSAGRPDRSPGMASAPRRERAQQQGWQGGSRDGGRSEMGRSRGGAEFSARAGGNAPRMGGGSPGGHGNFGGRGGGGGGHGGGGHGRGG